MNYLLISIMASMAMAMTVYAETSSISLAFAAYAMAGTLTLFTVLFSAWLENNDY